MHHRTPIILAFALLPLVCSACTSEKDRVKQTVEGYIAAERTGTDLAKKSLVTVADRKVLEENKQISVMNEEMASATREKLGPYVTVDIQSIDKKDGNATVEASVEAPTKQAVGDYLGPKVMKVAKKHQGESDEKVESAMNEKISGALDGHEFETETSTRTFELRREEGEWRVYRNLERRSEISGILDDADSASMEGNFETAHAKLESARKELESEDFADVERQADQVETNILTLEAKSLRTDGNYKRAIAKLEKATEFDVDGGPGGVGVSTSHVESTLEETKTYMSYRNKLKVKDVKTETVNYSETVTGKVQNGDRDLSFLEIRYLFKDDSGETIHEETEPVSVGEDVGAGETVSFEKKPYKDWTDEWSGDVDVEVSDFKFADSS